MNHTTTTHHTTDAAADLGTEGWHRPWSGSNNGNCVEVKKLDGGYVAIRQSTDPHGPALICPSSVVAEFVWAVKAGQADFLVS
ncbi:DUF397 domain-containing protein [Streptomyces sp. CWNU-52B]|uniref:DUF397 domain-containing protein n=1 Tax=unclassified Streptomyces TaxID=2593676 RepID=UPI0039C06E7F